MTTQDEFVSDFLFTVVKYLNNNRGDHNKGFKMTTIWQHFQQDHYSMSETEKRKVIYNLKCFNVIEYNTNNKIWQFTSNEWYDLISSLMIVNESETKDIPLHERKINNDMQRTDMILKDKSSNCWTFAQTKGLTHGVLLYLTKEMGYDVADINGVVVTNEINAVQFSKLKSIQQIRKIVNLLESE